MLDAQTGRWLTLDPFAGSAAAPQSFHKYAYAHADPINNTDPTGQYISALTNLIDNVFVYNTVVQVAARPQLNAFGQPLFPAVTVGRGRAYSLLARASFITV